MLDPIDQKLLNLLVWDGRLSLKEIASQVGLSSPSVAERIRRLQERGVLQRFTVDVGAKALGFPMQALVRIRPLPGKSRAVQAVIERMPEVSECDKVTGDDCFVARIVLRSIEELDSVLEPIVGLAETSTSIVKSQPVARRPAPFR